MNDMIEKARELGLALAESPEFLRVARARREVTDDSALCALMDDFRKQREALVTMMGSDEIDKTEAVAAGADLERLQQQLSEHPLFSEMIASEQSFSELLTAINEEINACIGLSNTSHCGGQCDSCGGCAH